MTGRGAKGVLLTSGHTGELDQSVPLRLAGILGVLARKVTIVHRLHFSSCVGCRIAALRNPFLAERRESLGDIPVEIGITPRPAAFINADGGVRFQLAVKVLSRGERDLAHWDTHLGMEGASDIYPTAGGKQVGALLFFGDGVDGCDHGRLEKVGERENRNDHA